MKITSAPIPCTSPATTAPTKPYGLPVRNETAAARVSATSAAPGLRTMYGTSIAGSHQNPPTRSFHGPRKRPAAVYTADHTENNGPKAAPTTATSIRSRVSQRSKATRLQATAATTSANTKSQKKAVMRPTASSLLPTTDPNQL